MYDRKSTTDYIGRLLIFLFTPSHFFFIHTLRTRDYHESIRGLYEIILDYIKAAAPDICVTRGIQNEEKNKIYLKD